MDIQLDDILLKRGSRHGRHDKGWTVTYDKYYRVTELDTKSIPNKIMVAGQRYSLKEDSTFGRETHLGIVRKYGINTDYFPYELYMRP